MFGERRFVYGFARFLFMEPSKLCRTFLWRFIRRLFIMLSPINSSFPSHQQTTLILHSHLFFTLLQMLSPIYLYIYIRKLTSLGSRKRTQHSPRNRPTRATHPERFWHIRIHFCREIRLSVWLRLCMN